jgi:hypothetical protein
VLVLGRVVGLAQGAALAGLWLLLEPGEAQ